MKLSFSWILDHISGPRPNLNNEFVGKVVAKFNSSVAEVDGCEKLLLDLDLFTVARVTKGKFFSPELGKELGDAADLEEGQLYLLRKDGPDWERASLADLGSLKDGLMPAINLSEDLLAGAWKKDFEKEDYILEIDNKSINHRPDLWGHRGFARELAAFFNLELAQLSNFVEKLPFEKATAKAEVSGFAVDNQAAPACRRFSALDVPNVINSASDLKMATRLARVDNRPIDVLVDVTNYVMCDIGQPMHAFDAGKFPNKKIVVRFAKPGEKLKLLDGSELELSVDDLVIADSEKAISLAGIMGGESSGVSANTKALFLESANFDPTVIRKSAERAKVRTEASSRFEKGLDPNQNVHAIERYLKLLKDLSITFSSAGKIISLGAQQEQNIIEVAHSLLEGQLGTQLEQSFVVTALSSIGFDVKSEGQSYLITVPSFRHNVSIPEDIVEEVGRLYGFENIPQTLPKRASNSTEHMGLKKLREIKKYLAFSADMSEVCNYPLFDEQFLHELGWRPENAVELANPVSENWKRLATSLVPTLLKNVFQNLKKSDQFSFFEVARTWQIVNGNPKESKVLSGIFYSEKKLDFYDCKAKLEKMFKMLGLLVAWKKAQTLDAWHAKGQVAELFANGINIGIAGNLDNQFLKKSFGGNAFAFELNLDVLLNVDVAKSKFKPIPKYQSTWLDISMMIPKSLDVDTVESAIKKSDSRVYKVELIDIFEKPEWKDKRSIAVRFHFVDENKTLTKEEIDSVQKEATEAVRALGAEVR